MHRYVRGDDRVLGNIACAEFLREKYRYVRWPVIGLPELISKNAYISIFARCLVADATTFLGE
jgi:hypothetical protein